MNISFKKLDGKSLKVWKIDLKNDFMSFLSNKRKVCIIKMLWNSKCCAKNSHFHSLSWQSHSFFTSNQFISQNLFIKIFNNSETGSWLSNTNQTVFLAANKKIFLLSNCLRLKKDFLRSISQKKAQNCSNPRIICLEDKLIFEYIIMQKRKPSFIIDFSWFLKLLLKFLRLKDIDFWHAKMNLR